MKPQFTIILPTYNEKENVPTLIEQILSLKTDADLRVLLVDDNSPDGTAVIVENKFENDPRVKVLNRKGLPRGLVNSLNHGISQCETDYLLWMDADLQMPADKIPELISVLLQNEMTAVFGSRFIPGGDDVRDENTNRGIVTMHKLLSKFLNRLGPVMLKLPATDITSGFVAIRKSYFRNHKLHGEHGEYFISLVNDLHQEGYKFSEIPYRLGKREAGNSKSTYDSYLGILKTGTRYIKVLLKHY